MSQNHTTEHHVDRRQVNHFFDVVFTRFLHIWVPLIVFGVPLMVFSYGYGVDTLRIALLLISILVGWGVWFIRATFIRGKIEWYGNSYTWILCSLCGLAILAGSVGADIAHVWGWTGIFAHTSPYMWIGVIGCMLLVQQYTQGLAQRIQLLLALYLASSTIIALILGGVWMWAGDFPLIFNGSLHIHALWLALNTTILFGFWHGQKGIARTVWLCALMIHVGVLMLLDATPAWVVLVSTTIIWTLLFALRERVLGKANYIAPLSIIVISIVLLFVSLHAVWPRIGFEAQGMQPIASSIIMPRYIDYMVPQNALFGGGVGLSLEQFWAYAELVDMRSVQNLPVFGNSYLVFLWEYGLLFTILFIVMCCWLVVRSLMLSKKILSKKIPTQFQLFVYVYIGLCIGLLSWIVVFASIPYSFMGMFSWAIMVSLLLGSMSLLQSEKPLQKKEWVMETVAEKMVLKLCTFLIIIALILFVALFSSRLHVRLSFFDTIQNTQEGTSINLEKLGRIIDEEPGADQFRFARMKFYQTAVEQAMTGEQIVDAEYIQPYLLPLSKDISALQESSLPGAQMWQIAYVSEYIGTLTQQLTPFFVPDASAETASVQLQDPTYWYMLAQKAYDRTHTLLPRNVIALVDAARFYREKASLLAQNNPETSIERYYKISGDLVARAQNIDDTFAPAYFEQAEQLLLQQKPEEALALVQPYIENDVYALYTAGRFAVAADNIDEAIQYYTRVLEQQHNHLQARYDLIQAYLAQDNQEQAKEQLDILESLIPQTDFRSRILVNSLRQLIESE